MAAPARASRATSCDVRVARSPSDRARRPSRPCSVRSPQARGPSPPSAAAPGAARSRVRRVIISDSASSLALRSSAFAAAHSPHFLSRPAFERVFSLEPRNWPPPTNLAPEPRCLSTSALCVCCSAACSDCSSPRSRSFSWSAQLDASTCPCTALSVTAHASTFAAGCMVLRGEREESKSVSWEGRGRRLGTCPVSGRSLSGRSYVIVGGDSRLPSRLD
eukprot:scaffold88769_cov39-Phaeocystis_antarctica.AAC.2